MGFSSNSLILLFHRGFTNSSRMHTNYWWNINIKYKLTIETKWNEGIPIAADKLLMFKTEQSEL